MTKQEAKSLVPDNQFVMTLNHECKGFDDRLVIYVDIKVPIYNQYSLDAQCDTVQ
jgi:hypothetical protein